MTLVAGVLRRDASGRVSTISPGAAILFNGGTPVGPAGDLQVVASAGLPSGSPTPTRDYNLLGPVLPADITFTRTTVATYFDAAGALQDSAINAPRFDYDPVTLAARGLLIEEARINLVLNNAVGVTQDVTVTAVAHTLSFVGTGSVALSGAFVGNLAGIGPGFGDRRTLTFTPAAGSLTLTVTGSVQWLQVEAGAFATSIIKTAGATVQRTNDVAAIAGAAFSAFWNIPEGTLQVTVSTFNVNSGFARLLSVVGLSQNDYIIFSRNNGDASTRFNVAIAASMSVGISPGGAGAMPLNVVSTLAGVYKNDDFAATQDGLPVKTDNTGTVPTTLERMQIGNWNGSLLCGWIKQARYWNTRLTDAQLQAMSGSGGGTYNGGLRYDNAGALVVAAGGAIANYVQGGLPVTLDGALCVAYGGAPVTFQAGIPFDAAGRVCMVAPVPPAELEAFDISFDDPAFG